MKDLSRISIEERKLILYRYIINDELLTDIYQDYKHLYKRSFFLQIPAHLLSISIYKEYVTRLLMGNDRYELYVNNFRVLGNKCESYWESEDDIIFHNSTFATLSSKEKDIYLSQY